jgi:hypothetical protein
MDPERELETILAASEVWPIGVRENRHAWHSRPIDGPATTTIELLKHYQVSGGHVASIWPLVV